MENMLTLIAGTGDARVDNSMVAVACEVLLDAGGRTGREVWLAEGRACDVPFAGLDPRAADAAARAALDGYPVDVVAQPAEGRRKRLLVADMESTIIDNEMIDEMAAAFGQGERIAAITARSMRGELDFTESLNERVAMLAGLDEATVTRLCGNIRLNPGAVTLVATMRAHGAWCALVSGGFTVYSAKVAALVGFDSHQANRLEIVDERLTGRVMKPVLDRHAKQAALLRLLDEQGLAARDAMAVGDGANDLSMILAAGLGVAYYGKPILAAAAAMRVEHGDLTALLFAQGYRAEEFVGAD